MKDGRTTSIRIRVTHEEKSRIEAAARASGVTVSRFLREMKFLKSNNWRQQILRMKHLVRELTKEFSKVQHRNPKEQDAVKTLLTELQGVIRDGDR